MRKNSAAASAEAASAAEAGPAPGVCGPEACGEAFSPAWFCRGPHLQSLWGYLFRKDPRPDWRRERWETPDGDFLLLDFLDPPDAGAPTLLILHGLEGSSDSHYVRGLAARAAARGWRAVAMNFRSCGGEMNRGPRLYHSGETGDLGFVAGRLMERFAGPVVLAAFSLGGNALLKWLGERGGSLRGKVAGAVAVSPAFEPGACALRLDAWRGSLYRWNLLASGRRKALDLAGRHPGRLEPEKVRRARTFVLFDRCTIAPLHGFADEKDYYARADSVPFLPAIRVPALVVASRDDPIVPPRTFPHAALRASPWLRGMLSDRGGHVGFVSGRSPRSPLYWAEKEAVAFLGRCLAGGGAGEGVGGEVGEGVGEEEEDGASSPA